VESSRPGEAVSQFRKLIFVLTGLICVAFGALGVLLPGLPTTPFLLLAVALFARSSPRLYRWLFRSRVFGPLLQEWQQHRAIRPQVRHTAVAAVVLGVGATCLLTTAHPAVKATALGAGVCGLAVVLRLPVRREIRQSEPEGLE
jgi:uncharacterized membrane protein YbaN (DUF454 family)